MTQLWSDPSLYPGGYFALVPSALLSSHAVIEKVSLLLRCYYRWLFASPLPWCMRLWTEIRWGIWPLLESTLPSSLASGTCWPDNRRGFFKALFHKVFPKDSELQQDNFFGWLGQQENVKAVVVIRATRTLPMSARSLADIRIHQGMRLITREWRSWRDRISWADGFCNGLLWLDCMANSRVLLA